MLRSVVTNIRVFRFLSIYFLHQLHYLGRASGVHNIYAIVFYSIFVTYSSFVMMSFSM